MRRRRAACGLWIAALVVAVDARAQTRGDATRDAEANALWAEGKRLMDGGEIAPACTKFETSLAIVPKLGTRLNLGHCYEALGRIASAWSAFQTAAAQARQANDKREAYARERAAALEPRVPRLVIAAPPGVEVSRDGGVVPGAVLGQAVPVDPGEHRVAASAPGHAPWQTTVVLEADGKTRTVRVPALARLPGAEPTPPPAATVVTVAPDRARPRRLIAAVVGGAGLASVVAGTVVVLAARSDWDASRDDCDEQNVCGPTGFDRATSARRKATIATVLFAAGAAAVGTGVVLWLTAPKPPRAAERAGWQMSPELAPRGGAIVVTRSF